MLRQILKFSWVIALFSITTFYACQQDESLDESVVDEYVDMALYSMQQEGNVGRLGCFELVFPISIQLPDSSVVEVADYTALAETLKAWKAANPGKHKRVHPHFVFPIEVVAENGDLITVNSKQELKELRKECAGEFGKHGHKGHKGKCTPCFEFVFPITIKFPDNTAATAESKEQLKEAIRTWKAANPDATTRPELSFPLKVKLTDGTEKVVNNAEELIALKKSCRP